MKHMDVNVSNLININLLHKNEHKKVYHGGMTQTFVFTNPNIYYYAISKLTNAWKHKVDFKYPEFHRYVSNFNIKRVL